MLSNLRKKRTTLSREKLSYRIPPAYLFTLYSSPFTLMSYEIYYKKCNIKLSDDTIIPYHLAGSNNCYEVNRNGSSGRRSRSWESSTFFCNGKISATEEEIRANVKNYIEKTYLEKHRSTDDYDKDFKEDYKSFPQFLEASSQWWFSMKIPGGKIKNMLSYLSSPTITIQELFEHTNSIQLMIYKDGYIWDQAKTEQELIEKMQAWYKISINEIQMDRILRDISKSKPTTARPKKEQAYAFTIIYGGYTILSYRGTGFKFSYSSQGKLFKTEAQARKVMEQLQKNTQARQTFEIKKIEWTFAF